MEFEYVTHNVLGKNITFALDKNNKDWYVETIRKRPFYNPVHNHLLKIRSSGSFEGILKYADFGANIGVTSYFAAAHGIATLAVEAGRTNLLILEESKRANGFDDTFQLLFLAASDFEGTLHFSENSAWGVISKERDGTYAVGCNTIANILDQHDFADAQVLKIDIEGAELGAMTGFESTISEGFAPDIIMESNEPACVRNNYSCQDLWARMLDLGYDVYQVAGRSLISLSVESAQDAQVIDILATRRSGDELTRSLGYTITPYSHETAKKNLEALLKRAPNKNGLSDFVARQMMYAKDKGAHLVNPV
jgi:FkbM family methyltransferase